MTRFPSPLPVVAFEEYMFRDDRPAHPMSIIARLRFRGQLDRRAATAAWDQVVARHPLLRARIEEGPRGRLAWVPAENHRPSIQWLDGSGPDRLPAMRPIDLRLEPGVRVWGSAGAEASSLSFQVHHAVCDGKAVLQVLDEFVRCYSCLVDGKPAVELPACDADALRGRGRFGLSAGKFLRMLPAQLTGLAGVRQFLMRQPVPVLQTRIACDTESGNLPVKYPTVKFGRLDAEEVRELSSAAAKVKVTVNDWLLRDFFVAVNDFRKRHQEVAADEWIRFSVPIDLRRMTDARMPAANAVSMVFLDRKPQEIAHAGSLLQGIHEEMDMMLRRQLGLTFIWSLWGLRMLPGGMARRVNSGRCEATCVVSNLGKALAASPLPRRDEKIVAGNVVLEGIDFFSPVRDGTSVTVGLVFYAGALQICMQYDCRRLNEAQADELLATYVRRIRESVVKAAQTTYRKAA